MTSTDPQFNPYGDDPLYNALEAAKYLGVCKTTFHNLRRNNAFPVCMFIGDIRVRRSDLNWFIRDHLDGGTTGERRDN